MKQRIGALLHEYSHVLYKIVIRNQFLTWRLIDISITPVEI